MGITLILNNQMLGAGKKLIVVGPIVKIIYDLDMTNKMVMIVTKFIGMVYISSWLVA